MTPKVRKYLRLLKRDFPLRKPVKVRTQPRIFNEKGEELHANCDLVNEVFLIGISRKFTESEQIESLWHEWTHCRIWPHCKYRHTKRFSDQYFAIYRKYLDD